MTEEREGLNERVASATPFDRVEITRCLAEIVAPSLEDLVIDGEGPEQSRLATLLRSALKALDDSSLVGPEEARELAALVLSIALADPEIAPALGEAVARHDEDENMSAIEVLSYGAAISAVILVATVKVEWTAGKSLRIVKQSLSDKTVIKLIEIVEKICRLNC